MLRRLEKYASGIKKYAFTDSATGRTDLPEDITPVLYDNSESYRNQFLSCIRQIKEKYIIYTSEDYILYDRVQQNIIEEIALLLDNTDYSFCKFIKGPERTEHFQGNLYVIDSQDSNLFAQQASLWDTRAFEKILKQPQAPIRACSTSPGVLTSVVDWGLRVFNTMPIPPRGV